MNSVNFSISKLCTAHKVYFFNFGRIKFLEKLNGKMPLLLKNEKKIIFKVAVKLTKIFQVSEDMKI